MNPSSPSKMYKEEIIHVHQLLVYLMRFLVDSGVPKSYFKEYADLGVSPHHIHRTRVEQKYATLLLAHGISKVLAEDGPMLFKKLETIRKT